MRVMEIIGVNELFIVGVSSRMLLPGEGAKDGNIMDDFVSGSFAGAKFANYETMMVIMLVKSF